MPAKSPFNVAVEYMKDIVYGGENATFEKLCYKVLFERYVFLIKRGDMSPESLQYAPVLMAEAARVAFDLQVPPLAPRTQEFEQLMKDLGDIKSDVIFKVLNTK